MRGSLLILHPAGHLASSNSNNPNPKNNNITTTTTTTNNNNNINNHSNNNKGSNRSSRPDLTRASASLSQPVEVLDSPTKAGLKRRCSSEPSIDANQSSCQAKRCGRDHYLRLAFDVLEASFSQHQWSEHRNAVFTESLAQAKSLVAMVSFLTRSAFA